MMIPHHKTTSKPVASLTSPPLFDALARSSALLRRRLVGVLLTVIAVSLLFHHQAAVLKSWHLFRIPFTKSYFDFTTLCLTLLMFTASVQCNFRDFRHLVGSPRAAVAGLVLHYFVVPILAVACSSVAVSVFDGDAAVQIRIGLVFIALMPVALTAAVWVRANSGNVPLLLALVVITTAAALLTVPFYVRVLPGMGGGHVVVPVAEMIKQVIVSITIPMLAGMTVNQHFPKFVARWQPAFSLLGMVSLLASSGSNVGAAAPMIAAHSSLLAAAAMATLFVSAVSYGLGLVVARRLGLTREDALCLTFSSGMKNPAAAMVIGAASFPTMPLVPVPAALCSIVQHLIAGFLTKSFETEKNELLGPALGRSPVDLEDHLVKVFREHGRRDPDLALVIFELEKPKGGKPAAKQTIASVRRMVRTDDFVCVLPPNGFAIALPRTDAAGAMKVGEKIARLVAQTSQARAVRWGFAKSETEETRTVAQFMREARDAARNRRLSLPDNQLEESCTRSPSFLATESAPK